ncbi:pseudouridine synthase [Roseateles oligotrophus]|uniref:Dual-specificity RNA pseudouridine synthase RluF n=1 Tax=Roseateles oligotrophus TaxID=1769250 RepID=A0ABT2YG01_9BURK|nr:pseudouridine synthase [Roseateles oligotrophus]MCV2368938.1 pseudouridine synthase [Roseateles oligotrophus]
MATLKLNNKKKSGPNGSSRPDGERRPPVRGKGVSRPRQSLERAQAERQERQAQYEQRQGGFNSERPASAGQFAGSRDERARPPAGPRHGAPEQRGGRGGPGGHQGSYQGGPRRDAGPRRDEGPRYEDRRPQGNYDRPNDYDSRGPRGPRDEAPRYEERRPGGYQGQRPNERPPMRDSRDSRDFRDSRDQAPRFDERRPQYDRPRQDQQGYSEQRPRQQYQGGGGGGYNAPREQGSYRQDPREQQQYQQQRPRYEDRGQGGYRGQGEQGGQGGFNQQQREEPGQSNFTRQDQRRASGPRPGQSREPSRGPTSPSSYSQAAARQLPEHLRAAAAQLSRQLGDDDEDEDCVDSRDEGVRLSKHMGVLGMASRREADEWIAAGWVRVDGKMAVLGQRVLPGVKIEVDQLANKEQAKRVTILLHKPIGWVSGQAEDGYENASTLIKSDSHWAEDTSGIKYHLGHSRGLAPAGRLDIDSTGLLVLTQDGRIAKLLIGEDSKIEKEYLVRVEYHGRDGVKSADGSFPAADMALLNHGLELDGVQLKPAKVSWANEDQLRFVLREGRKRQIRRMCEQVGLKVVGLKRVRIGRINLGNLPVGQWRFLTPWERFD